jgi:hypothetical protein
VRVPLPGGKAFGPTGGLYNRVLASYTKFMQLPFLPRLTEDDVWIDRKVWFRVCGLAALRCWAWVGACGAKT